MTHRGPFQPLPFCDSVIAIFLYLNNFRYSQVNSKRDCKTIINSLSTYSCSTAVPRLSFPKLSSVVRHKSHHICTMLSLKNKILLQKLVQQLHLSRPVENLILFCLVFNSNKITTSKTKTQQIQNDQSSDGSAVISSQFGGLEILMVYIRKKISCLSFSKLHLNNLVTHDHTTMIMALF